jgi:3-methyladenine DNA glycosylase/8-oxoguanine DNA glycosylase
MNFKKITPKVISKIPKETLLAIGLSPQKITLLKEISIDILDKKLSLGKLEKLSNNEIAQTLIKYKYVGQ